VSLKPNNTPLIVTIGTNPPREVFPSASEMLDRIEITNTSKTTNVNPTATTLGIDFPASIERLVVVEIVVVENRSMALRRQHRVFLSSLYSVYFNPRLSVDDYVASCL
jgi:hypothetical protein